MGMGGMARYMTAWMDADVNEKKRILQLMKESAGMGETMTRTAGMQQTMGLREAQEKRVQQLFPPQLETAEAGARQETSRAGTMERQEQEAVDAATAVSDVLKLPPASIAALAKAFGFQEQGQMAEARMGAGLPTALAGQQIQEARTGREVARVEQVRQIAEDVSGAIPAQALARREVAATQAGTALYERDKLKAARAEGLPVKEARAAGAMAEAQVSTAGAVAAEAAIRKAVEDYKLSLDKHYEEIIAMAEIEKPGLENALLVAKAESEEATQRGARAKTRLELLQEKMSPEDFAKYLIKAANIEAGIQLKTQDILDKIESTSNTIASIQVQLSQGRGTTIDDVMMQMWIQSNPDGVAMFADRDETVDISPEEILRGLQAYKRVQIALLADQGIDYSRLQMAGMSAEVYDMQSIDDIIRRIEGNQQAPGIIGDDIRLYGTGVSAAKRTDVYRYILNLVNSNVAPMRWERAFDTHAEALKAGQNLTDQDINAAISIIRSLLNFKMNPEQLPLPVETPGVVE